MEPIGQKFKDARKEKGLFIEQVSRETNISKKYIEAIEEENFSDFPGEAYILGFLRSYAGYLGIDVEEIITLYKKTKIQEQPVPVELIEPKSGIPLVPILAAGSILIIAAAVFLFFYFGDLNGSEPKVVKEKKSESAASGDEYEMNSAFIERRFTEGDTVIVRYKDKPYRIVLEKTGEKVLLEIPSGRVEVAKGKELLSDLDGDSINDIRILVRDIDSSGKGAVLKFDRNTEAPSIASSGISSEEELSDVSDAAVAAAAGNAPASVPASGSPAVQSRKQTEQVILESDIIQPFTVNLVFRGYCLMRYEADGGKREERYFHKGDTFRFDVSKNIRIWISNAASVSASINNIDYSFGSAGSVASKIFRWIEKPGGGFAVKAVPLY